MSSSPTLKPIPPLIYPEIDTNTPLNPEHVVILVIIEEILGHVLPYMGRWTVVCLAVSYFARMMPVFLAVRILDLGFGVKTKAQGLANSERQPQTLFTKEVIYSTQLNKGIPQPCM